MWVYIAIFCLGFIGGLISMSLILKKSISNNKIEISRPKIKNSPDAQQDFVSEIKDTIQSQIERPKRKLFNLKRKKHGIKNVD
jgi:hypothetical protein